MLREIQENEKEEKVFLSKSQVNELQNTNKDDFQKKFDENSNTNSKNANYKTFSVTNIPDEMEINHRLRTGCDDKSFQDNNDNMNLCYIFTNLGRLLLVNFLFLIFNNSQLSIILFFTNKKYQNDDDLTNGIGIINTYMNILIYPFILGCASSFEILGSQSFGRKDFNFLKNIISKIKFTGRIFLVGMFIFSYIFNECIINLWKFDNKVVDNAVKILLIRLFSIFFEFEIFMQLRYIQIINRSREALIIILTNGLCLPIFCFIFIKFLNLYALGCGLSYLMTNIFLMISLKIYIMIFNLTEENLEENLKKSESTLEYEPIEKNQKIIKCEEMQSKNELQLDLNEPSIETKEKVQKIIYKEYETGQLLRFILPLFLISLMDNLSVESMSLFANGFDQKSYSDFINVYSLYNLIGTFSLSFNTSASILMSSNVTKRSSEQFKILFKNLLMIGFLIAFVMGSLLFFSSGALLQILHGQTEISYISRSMFMLSIICNMIDIIQYILLSTLKSLGYIYLGFAIYLLGNSLNLGFIYLFSHHTNMKILGIFFGYMINEFILASTYGIIILLFVEF